MSDEKREKTRRELIDDIARLTAELAELRALELAHDGACVRLKGERDALRGDHELAIARIARLTAERDALLSGQRTGHTTEDIVAAQKAYREMRAERDALRTELACAETAKETLGALVDKTRDERDAVVRGWDEAQERYGFAWEECLEVRAMRDALRAEMRTMLTPCEHARLLAEASDPALRKEVERLRAKYHALADHESVAHMADELLRLRAIEEAAKAWADCWAHDWGEMWPNYTDDPCVGEVIDAILRGEGPGKGGKP